MGVFSEFRKGRDGATGTPTNDAAPEAISRTRSPVPVEPTRTPTEPTLTRVDGSAAAEASRLTNDVEWFELKKNLHDAVLEQMNLSMIEKVDRAELRRELSALIVQHLSEADITLGADQFKKLVSELLDEVLGLGPLEPFLKDNSVSDILVNGHDSIYVERYGLLERSGATFRDEKHLLRIIDKIVSRVGRRIDESQPYVDARLPDGSRVNAIIRPCAIDGPSLSIRKFSADKLTLEGMVKFGALSEGAARFLESAVAARMNILISGGTGSGKTTLLNALSSFVDPRQRIVTIEDAAELQLQQDHVVRLETRPTNTEGAGEINQRTLVKNALRMRPDRIIIGEVRGSEAFDMLQAMNTGHDGSMTTIHANTARDALSRLEQMLVMIGGDFPLSAARTQLASGINIVIQLNRLSDGSRRVMSISEINGLESSTVLMQEIYRFTRKGRDSDGRVIGRFGPTGVRPRCVEAIEAAGFSIPVSAFTAEEPDV